MYSNVSSIWYSMRGLKSLTLNNMYGPRRENNFSMLHIFFNRFCSSLYKTHLKTLKTH